MAKVGGHGARQGQRAPLLFSETQFPHVIAGQPFDDVVLQHVVAGIRTACRHDREAVFIDQFAVEIGTRPVTGDRLGKFIDRCTMG